MGITETGSYTDNPIDCCKSFYQTGEGFYEFTKVIPCTITLTI